MTEVSEAHLLRYTGTSPFPNLFNAVLRVKNHLEIAIKLRYKMMEVIESSGVPSDQGFRTISVYSGARSAPKARARGAP